MKSPALATLALICTSAALHAGPVESALVAAMKLPDAPNYTWSTSVDDDARSYTIDGKTDRAGDLSLVDMPMVAAMRRRSGRGSSNSENQVTAAFKGDEKLVLDVNDKWQTPDEIRSAARSDSSGYGGWRGGASGMGRRRGGPGGGPGGRGGDGSGAPPFSNLQQTLSRPHEEIAIIVANSTDLKAEDDGVSGTLSETGAKLLLVHPGQTELTPLRAAGTFRLWVRDGALVKYQVKLEGALAVNANGTRREVEVHQTANTTLSNAGTTAFEVPADAKKKLGG
ncbi:MAG TPA: hypothetical protein VHD62_04800 [Opitutaceae bacterium]|nr:hypothetical protein [Opitutaceae bacterium]